LTNEREEGDGLENEVRQFVLDRVMEHRWIEYDGPLYVEPAPKPMKQSSY